MSDNELSLYDIKKIIIEFSPPKLSKGLNYFHDNYRGRFDLMLVSIALQDYFLNGENLTIEENDKYIHIHTKSQSTTKPLEDAYTKYGAKSAMALMMAGLY